MKSSGLLVLIFVLGILSRNRLIYISAGVLLLFSFLKLMPQSISAQNIFQDLGVILLVMGVLMPLSSGKVTPRDLYRALFSLEGIISFLVGVASSVMASDGIELMRNYPAVMVGLLFGSIIGAAFFKGIPTGPLVAAGLAAFVISLLKRS